MVIKLDGIDGCGKTTIINSLYNKYVEQNKSVKIISEFAGKEYENDIISKEIRLIIEKDENLLDEFEREVLFTVISRRTNLYLIPKLQLSFDIILVDRSEIANYTYGLSINENFKNIYDLILETNLKENTKIFWLDTPIDICLERINERQKLSLNEKKGKIFFQSILQKFKHFAENNQCTRIEGNRDVETITNEIMNLINDQKNNGT